MSDDVAWSGLIFQSGDVNFLSFVVLSILIQQWVVGVWFTIYGACEQKPVELSNDTDFIW